MDHPAPDGRSLDIDLEVVRDGKNLKGRALASVLAVLGTRILGKKLHDSVAAVEARNGRADGRGSTES